jgi:hypothetical protein
MVMAGLANLGQAGTQRVNSQSADELDGGFPVAPEDACRVPYRLLEHSPSVSSISLESRTAGGHRHLRFEPAQRKPLQGKDRSSAKKGDPSKWRHMAFTRIETHGGPGWERTVRNNPLKASAENRYLNSAGTAAAAFVSVPKPDTRLEQPRRDLPDTAGIDSLLRNTLPLEDLAYHALAKGDGYKEDFRKRMVAFIQRQPAMRHPAAWLQADLMGTSPAGRCTTPLSDVARAGNRSRVLVGEGPNMDSPASRVHPSGPLIQEFLRNACVLASLKHASPLYAFLNEFFHDLSPVDCEYLRTYLRLHTHYHQAKTEWVKKNPVGQGQDFKAALDALIEESAPTRTLEKKCDDPNVRSLLKSRLGLVAWNAWNRYLLDDPDASERGLGGYAKSSHMKLTNYERSAINAARNGYLSDAKGSELAAIEKTTRKLQTWVKRGALSSMKRRLVSFYRKSPFYRMDLGLRLIGKSAYNTRGQQALEIVPRALKLHRALFMLSPKQPGASYSSDSIWAQTRPLEEISLGKHAVASLIFERVLLEYWSDPAHSFFSLRHGRLAPENVSNLAKKAEEMAAFHFPLADRRQTRRNAEKWLANAPLARDTLLHKGGSASGGPNILHRIAEEYNARLDDAGRMQKKAHGAHGATKQVNAVFLELDKLRANGEARIKNEAALEYAWMRKIIAKATPRLAGFPGSRNAFAEWSISRHKALEQAVATAKLKLDSLPEKSPSYVLEHAERRLFLCQRELLIFQNAQTAVTAIQTKSKDVSKKALYRDLLFVPEKRMRARLEFNEAALRLKDLLIASRSSKFDAQKMVDAIKALQWCAHKLRSDNLCLAEGDRQTLVLYDSSAGLKRLVHDLSDIKHSLEGARERLGRVDPGNMTEVRKIIAPFRVRRSESERMRRTLMHIQSAMDQAYAAENHREFSAGRSKFYQRTKQSRKQNFEEIFRVRARRNDIAGYMNDIGKRGMQLGENFQYYSGNALQGQIGTGQISSKFAAVLTLGLAQISAKLKFGRSKVAFFSREVLDGRAQFQYGTVASISGGANLGAGAGVLDFVGLGGGIEAGVNRSKGRMVTFGYERDGSLEIDGARTPVRSRGDPVVNGERGLGKTLKSLLRPQAGKKINDVNMVLDELGTNPQLSVSGGSAIEWNGQIAGGLNGGFADVLGTAANLARRTQRSEFLESTGSTQMRVVQMSRTTRSGVGASVLSADAGAYLGSIGGFSPGEFQCKLRVLGANAINRGQFQPGNSARMVGVTSIRYLKALLSDEVKLAMAHNLLRTRPEQFAKAGEDSATGLQRALLDVESYIGACEKSYAETNGNWEAKLAFELTGDGATIWNRHAAAVEAGIKNDACEAHIISATRMPDAGDLDNLQRYLIELSDNPTVGLALIIGALGSESEDAGKYATKSSGRTEGLNILLR